MPRRRTIGLIMVMSIILVVVGGLYLRQISQQFMQIHGLQTVKWEGLTISLSGLTVDQLEVLQVQHERQLKVEAGALSLNWQWQWTGPRPTSLSLNTLHIDWQVRGDTVARPDTSQSLDLPEVALRWLPTDLNIGAFHARVPCATGHCDLEGALNLTRGADLLPVIVNLDLEHEGHLVQIEGHLAGQSLDDLGLDATLSIDGKPHLELHSRYWSAAENQQTGWSGALTMPELPQADWLLAWLENWYPMAVSELPSQPENASIEANWELTGPGGPNFFQSLSGNLTVSAHLPQPWPIPGIATAQGDVELALVAAGGHWQARAADADLKLRNPGGWAQQLPEFLRPDTLEIKINPSNPIPGLPKSERFVALDLALISRGQARVTINSHLAVATTKPWMLEIGETRIEASTPDFRAGGWKLREATAGISVSGHMDEQEMALVFESSSRLEIPGLTNPEIDTSLQLRRVQADLSQLSVKADYSLEDKAFESFSVKGPLTLTAAEVSQALLRTQSWRFTGVLDSDARDLTLEGKLSSGAGTVANLDLAYPFGGELTMTGRLVMDGEVSAQALADTFDIWPRSLQITTGEVSANANLKLPSAGSPELDAQISMKALSGIYDRTAWTALNGHFDIVLKGSQLAIEVPEMTLAEVNPGVTIGPVTLRGGYLGSTDDTAGGALKLDRATANFLGGRMQVLPDTWYLADLPLRIPVEFSAVRLAELMRVYPAEGLAGTGTLSGEVPLLIEREGISVDGGKVTAIKPGGTLRLPADRLRSFAQGNQAMELVAGAMENFHYSVLNSTIDYDQDGRLFLGLHLEGSNPDIENGHPIVLNINIEEDIPALLTSLQLSGRVNEAVTERVRELMQKRETRQGDANAEH